VALSVPEAAFAELANHLLPEPDVSEGRIFASNGLKAHGRIFAMLSRERLVVKLPAERCTALVAGGAGVPFESGGRRMREWVTLTDAPDAGAWLALAQEALAFAREQHAG
jgi:hypothetical protein